MKCPSNYEGPRFPCDVGKQVTFQESRLKTSPFKGCPVKPLLSPDITYTANICPTEGGKALHDKENSQHDRTLEQNSQTAFEGPNAMTGLPLAG
ncbi:hypothetical protein DPEC_G00034210 [Dallia pectoralis]|uniref:Uncharacterized protein n=1 Tax=Dallia pectoralis TaxID=75939 RepID=A0ACC2HD30_DALPE|nr:hypothetical protein DPEC_G00034210 [Dallia pectoralis]